jgi:PEGA domain
VKGHKKVLFFGLIAAIPLTIAAKGAEVVLTSDPIGAEIYIGAAKMGTTPLVLDLAAGLSIKVTSRFDPLAPVEQTVIPDDKQIMSYRFQHLYGTLIATSDHNDATLTIDGADFGRLPTLLSLSPGEHKLIFRAPNVPDKTRTVEVEVGYRTVVKIDFAGGSPDTKIEPDSRPDGSPSPTPTPGPRKRTSPMLVLVGV